MIIMKKLMKLKKNLVYNSHKKAEGLDIYSNITFSYFKKEFRLS